MPARSAFVPAATLAAAFTLAGCGSDTPTADAASGSRTVRVSAGDTTCGVATTTFERPGTVRFDVENAGRDVTEVYVYGRGAGGEFDKVVGEVENIAPGTSRGFEVELGSGDYEVACKPGQKGRGIRTPVTVRGDRPERP